MTNQLNTLAQKNSVPHLEEQRWDKNFQGIELLLSQFDHLIQTPADVDKLNAAILDWAVRGKLLPQDPNDEPASMLLERIAAEKARLVEAGKIKKPKKLAPIVEDEVPFVAPAGWVWTRFPDIGELNRGKSKHRPRNDILLYEDGKYPFIQTGDVARSDGRIRAYNSMYSDFGLAQSRMWPKGTLCITIAANIAETGILDFDACFPDSIVGFIPSNFIGAVEYFQYMVKVAKSQLEEYAPSTAQKNINLQVLSNLLIPLPPAKEILRIVAKVDELFAQTHALADELRAVESSRSHFCASAIHALTSAQTPAQTQSAWQPMVDNLAALTANAQSVDQLKQAILQLAVSGRLVPQDPNDEPASVLLERIAAEKARLVEAGEIKKPKKLNPIEEDEIPFEVPEGWVWVQFGAISLSLRYGTSKKCSYETIGVPVLRIPNIANGFINTSDLKYAELTQKEQDDLALNIGDLLLIRSNGSANLVGRSAIINKSTEGFAFAGYLVRARFIPDSISFRFLYLSLETPHIRKQIEGPIRTTTGVKNINSQEISNLILSFPPLAEQKRIVAKVDELHAFCDQLAGEATTASTARERLLAAILAQSV